MGGQIVKIMRSNETYLVSNIDNSKRKLDF